MSMGVVVLVAAALLGVTYRPHQQVTYPVDYEATLQQAAADAAFPMVVPRSVPSGWSVTVARYEPETLGPRGSMRLYLGFTTSTGAYVAVWQSNGRRGAIIASATNDAQCLPSDGQWQRCEVAKPETRALVQATGDDTLVLAGTATWEDLMSVADSLVPLRK